MPNLFFRGVTDARKADHLQSVRIVLHRKLACWVVMGCGTADD